MKRAHPGFHPKTGYLNVGPWRVYDVMEILATRKDISRFQSAPCNFCGEVISDNFYIFKQGGVPACMRCFDDRPRLMMKTPKGRKACPRHTETLPKGLKRERITLDTLMSWYHVPLKQAAKGMDVSVTYLKNLCRMHGINEWPYRQLSKANIASTSDTEDSAEEEQWLAAERLLSLRCKKRRRKRASAGKKE